MAAAVEINIDAVLRYFRHERTVIRYYIIRATAIHETLIMRQYPHLVVDAAIYGMHLMSDTLVYISKGTT